MQQRRVYEQFWTTWTEHITRYDMQASESTHATT